MQHLNLYSQLDRAVEPLFSGRQQTGIISIVFVVMLFAYGWLAYSGNSLQSERDSLQREQSNLEASLAELNKRKAQLEKRKKLLKNTEL